MMNIPHLGAILLLTLAASLAPALAHGAMQEVRVIAVGVDSLSSKASQKAIDFAKRRAVFIAAGKLGVKDPGGAVSRFTASQYGEIIRGANVVQSRRVGDTTTSEVVVTIIEQPLRRALKLDAPPPPAADVATTARAVLLLSLYHAPEKTYLWENENLLRAPLSDEVRRQSRAGVLLSGGDFDDRRLIDYQNALSVTAEELKPMFARYGAEEIIIAVLTLGPAQTADASNILLRRLRLDRPARNEIIEITPETTEEKTDTRIAKAAAAIASAVTQIATSTSENELALRSGAIKLPAMLHYVTPAELSRMQAALRAAPEVLYLELPTITLSQVRGIIYLKGDAAALEQRLKKQGIRVTINADGWTLSLR